MSMDQHIFSDIKEAWKHFLSFEPPAVKSNDQELWKGVIKGIKDDIHCSRSFCRRYVQGL